MSLNTNNPNTRYPVPVVSHSKDPDDVTIGIFKGELSGQRPFVADIWWWDNFVGVTYRFSRIGLENVTEDEIVSLLEESGQIKKVNPDTRKLVSGLIDLKDDLGNDILNISIHLGIADRITYKDADDVTRSFISSEVVGSDGGHPPMMEILEPSVDILIMALIIIQIIDNMPIERKEEYFNSLTKEFREYIQELRK